MTPAQEAKNFALAHGFTIVTRDRRYAIYRGNVSDLKGEWREITEVGGYPAALNAMKRWVDEHKSEVVNVALTDAAGRYVVAQVERGEVEKARDAGADVKVVPGWDKVDTSVEDSAGKTHGEWVDSPIIPTDAEIDALIKAAPVPIATGEVFDKPVYAQQYGRAKRFVEFGIPADTIVGQAPAFVLERPLQKKYMTIEEARGAALANPAPHHPWRVWQRAPGNEGRWHQLLAFSNRAEAVKYCRQLANIRSLRNLTREIRYEV